MKVSLDTLSLNHLGIGCPKSAEPQRRMGGPSLILTTTVEVAISRRTTRRCTTTTITSNRGGTLRKFGNILNNNIISNNNRIITLSATHNKVGWPQECHDHTVPTFWSTRPRVFRGQKGCRQTTLHPISHSDPSLASARRSVLMTSGPRRCMRRRCEKVPAGNMTSGRCGRSLAGLVTPSADQAQQHLPSQSLLVSSSRCMSPHQGARRRTHTGHREATQGKCPHLLSIRTRARAEIRIERLHITSSRTTRRTRRTRRLQH